ncbi:MAG TPA: DoxX family protein [Thermoanaerobaculia bacterium]|nr:DoxX family protein [Thermoanaerobaculia bacterium]
MRNPLAPYTDAIYALFRFFAGFLFVFHGTQKLFSYPGERPPVDLLSLAGLAGLIETVGGTMIALGLFAAPAAFIASGTMAVAYFLRHAEQGFLPIVNRGELAILYCFSFLLIAAMGSGRYSIDGIRRRPKA